jgi:hypothetical protein
VLSLTAQIQAMLDSIGVHLDAESFANLCRFLRIDRLSWAQKLGIAVGLGVVAELLRKRAKDEADKAAAAAAAAVAAGAR